jgi:hypothetical protein
MPILIGDDEAPEGKSIHFLVDYHKKSVQHLSSTNPAHLLKDEIATHIMLILK